MKAAVLLLFCLPATAFASKPKDADYQDAVLVSFRTVSSGTTCAGNGQVKGSTDANGDVTGTSNSTASCSDNSVVLYTVQVGPNIFVLHRAYGGGQAATSFATAGISTLFSKSSVLANQLPGTKLRVRTDTAGFYVKLGKRESRYTVEAAH